MKFITICDLQHVYEQDFPCCYYMKGFLHHHRFHDKQYVISFQDSSLTSTPPFNPSVSPKSNVYKLSILEQSQTQSFQLYCYVGQPLHSKIRNCLINIGGEKLQVLDLEDQFNDYEWVRLNKLCFSLEIKNKWLQISSRHQLLRSFVTLRLGFMVFNSVRGRYKENEVLECFSGTGAVHRVQ